MNILDHFVWNENMIAAAGLAGMLGLLLSVLGLSSVFRKFIKSLRGCDHAWNERTVPSYMVDYGVNKFTGACLVMHRMCRTCSRKEGWLILNTKRIPIDHEYANAFLNGEVDDHELQRRICMVAWKKENEEKAAKAEERARADKREEAIALAKAKGCACAENVNKLENRLYIAEQQLRKLT